jgi:hypothetical protein
VQSSYPIPATSRTRRFPTTRRSPLDLYDMSQIRSPRYELASALRYMQSYRTVTHASSGPTFAMPSLYYAEYL